eukprot:UN06399
MRDIMKLLFKLQIMLTIKNINNIYHEHKHPI